ncbi:MAG: hypothetical protein LCI00_08480 [Chloroflexi bacterium]|nr:hypothetical protein [Chloroflexota bacterium]
MNKLNAIFLILLALATLASGQLWAQIEAFLNGQGSLIGAALGTLSAILLTFALLALGRIVYRTSSVQKERTLQNQQEGNHA